LAGQATLSEVSLSGARLVCSLPLPIGSVVLVQFAVRRADATPKRVTLEAEVIRQTDTGIALEWTEFAPEAARALYAPRIDAAADIAPFQPKERCAGG
jgi:hypothetical protein